MPAISDYSCFAGCLDDGQSQLLQVRQQVSQLASCTLVTSAGCRPISMLCSFGYSVKTDTQHDEITMVTVDFR